MITKRVGTSDDRALAARIEEDGDEAAFRELYRRHTPALHLLVLRLVGGEEGDADDIVQETWIRAVEALPRFRWESGLRTWLTGIAINIVRSAERKRRTRGDVELDVDAVLAAAAPDPMVRLDLERAIGVLPDGYRSVLVLHDVEGFTHEEIAERLGIAVGTSKSQLSHARRAVRTTLGWQEKEDLRNGLPA